MKQGFVKRGRLYECINKSNNRQRGDRIQGSFASKNTKEGTTDLVMDCKPFTDYL